MMKPYPKYKNSGIEWIGDIPEHWNMIKFRLIANGIGNGTTATQISYKTNYPVSRIETISSGNIDFNKVGYLNQDDAIDSYILNKGDILLSHINSLAMVGNCAQYWDNKVLIHGMNLLRVQPNEKISKNYLLWNLKSHQFKNSIKSIAKHAINQVSVPVTSLKQIKLSVPPLETQRQIASYLDHKTQQIDTLIEKKQRLIELLKEERTAVINEAVTKGLDLNVPMKYSGIEWIGNIPEHWEVVSAKHLEKNSSYLAQTGPFGAQLHASDYVEEGTPLILIKNVNGLKIDSSDIPKITQEKADQLSLYRLKCEDIVFSRVGSIGRIALITEREKGWLISGQMLRLRFKNKRLIPQFAVYVISSKSIQTYFKLKSVGTTRDSINTEILKGMLLTLPPIDEQAKIVDFIQKEVSRIDTIITKAEKAIELLQEYRTALISEVVTGEIDIRNWRKPEHDSHSH